MKKFNKKGFTLVELIVVIAVLAVLAAILIPMMTSYVLKSRIATANASASKIRDNITYYLADASCKGYGLPMSKNIICDAEIVLDNGEWQITLSDETVFEKSSNITWNQTGSATMFTDVTDCANATKCLAQYLAETFQGEPYGYIKARLSGGMCSALYFTKDQNTAVVNFPGFGGYNGWSVPDYAWMDDEQGLYSSGIIVGTSPMLPLSDV